MQIKSKEAFFKILDLNHKSDYITYTSILLVGFRCKLSQQQKLNCDEKKINKIFHAYNNIICVYMYVSLYIILSK